MATHTVERVGFHPRCPNRLRESVCTPHRAHASHPPPLSPERARTPKPGHGGAQGVPQQGGAPRGRSPLFERTHQAARDDGGPLKQAGRFRLQQSDFFRTLVRKTALKKTPDSHARSAHNPGLRLSLSILAGLTLARPALAPPAIAPPTIVRCCCCSRRRSRYMYRPCSRRPCSRRPCSRRPCSCRPCSTHVETCGHGGMDRRARQHAGQRMRGGGGGSHEQPKHCERSMESTRIEWWPWRER